MPSRPVQPSEPVRVVAPMAPLWTMGFRVFFPLAGLAAALTVPAWLLGFAGRWTYAGPIGAQAWHAHEMLFGYAPAVVAGFLLTAARNWTGLATAQGGRLAGLASLWLAGRGAMLAAADLPPFAVAAIDLAFLPALAAEIGRVLVRAGNRRNLFVVGLLGLLALANLAFHAGSALGPMAVATAALRAALGVILVLLTVFGGRVIPFFTRAALPGLTLWQVPFLDRAAVALTALFALTQAASPVWPAVGLAAGAAGLLAGLFHLVRLAGWKPWAVRVQPLLWILHLGQFWLGTGLILAGLGAFGGPVPADVGLHALAAGALGCLSLGMMTRVTLGHGGRNLRANPAMVTAFGLIALAAAVRVLTPLVPDADPILMLSLAGSAWSIGFLLFVGAIWPIVSARPAAAGC